MFRENNIRLFLRVILCPLSCFLVLTSAHASYIETTVGTAVVNDATASFYNPAALVLVKNLQLIPQGSFAYLHNEFSGRVTQILTGVSEDGNSRADTHYFSPSFFAGMPVTDKITLGLAMVSNYANRDVESGSILRYVQANNNIQDFDVVPAFGFKINPYFSVGAGVNFSYVNFDLRPIYGVFGASIADSQSRNDCDGTGVGANAGILLRPTSATLIGVNYRTVTTYRLSGSSEFDGAQQVVSDDYHFKLRTPARTIMSINQFVTPSLGFIGTIQRLQWSIIRNINVSGIANLIGSQPIIFNSSVPYHLHNAWLATLGVHYRVTPQWILRLAGSYNQSPGNKYYQIVNGDSMVLGFSTGYEISKRFLIDGSYAHVFMHDQGMDINNGRFLIDGVNQGARDAVSVKMTFNL